MDWCPKLGSGLPGLNALSAVAWASADATGFVSPPKINAPKPIPCSLRMSPFVIRFDFEISQSLTLRRPLRRKLRITDPHQIFDAHFLENTDLSPSRFHFSVGFISRSCFESDGLIAYSNEWDWKEKTMFIHTNQPLITSFYIKRYLFFAELAMSKRWSAIYCATGARGLMITLYKARR